MRFARLIVLAFVLLNLQANGQNLKGDYAEAANLSLNQKYTFKNSAVGFGREQEYPPQQKRKSYLFERERNTAWFSFAVFTDGFLTFEISPLQNKDDYDWMLFKETSNQNNQSIDYDHPIRTNNSRNELFINGKTGLKNGFTDSFTSPGLGKSFCKLVQVHAGENYILVVDNIYPGGKGFTFFSSVEQDLSPSKPKTLSGILTDKNSMQPLTAEISVEDSAGKTLIKTASDANGKYSFQIPQSAYTLSVVKKGYVLLNDFVTDQPSKNYELQTIKPDAKIVFYNIRFLPNSAAIVNASGNDLKRLLALLQEEKELAIQIIGHTNANIFTDERYLQRLSEKRALAVKTYLLQHGIANNRMRCFGLGGKYPLFDNKKPEEAVKNLRVEVVLER